MAEKTDERERQKIRKGGMALWGDEEREEGRQKETRRERCWEGG